MDDTRETRRLREQLAELRERFSTTEISNKNYRHFFEKSTAMIYATGKKGQFSHINQAGAELLGFTSPEEVLGRTFKDFFSFNDKELESSPNILGKISDMKETEAILERRDGHQLSVQLSSTTRTSLLGKVTGYEGFAIDITKQKLTENRLATSETRYRTVLDNSLAAIYMFQDGGYFSYVNPRMVKVLGYDSADELIGKPFWEVIADDDREMVRLRGLEREHNEIYPRRYKYKMLKKDGEEIWVDMRAAHASSLGKPAAVGNFIDITKEVRAEEQVRLLTRQLIEGIEEERRSLANDIHDEFGQSLTSLQFEIESLKNAIPTDRENAAIICNKVTEQIQNLAEKVRDTTSKLRPDLLDHLGLEPTLNWYLNDISQARPEQTVSFQAVGLKKRLPSEVELVLYRVFQEGLNNIAKHANASLVDIQLTYSHPDIILIIKDNGCGFHIGKEGVSENDPRNGIGLLSMKERVAALSGSFSIRSAPGKGTVLRVKIPMSD
ncbi:PAS domain-containing sensor histidine kinase [Desulfosediminicola ganghwensis]|uniref:PAS domain-containing sensor histidine kinase n=1 Tax=Desulfosediminicola ganghwensis TaxID=2569540 RepID=UPI0010ACC91B|nr:PAS domain S-box protein [Desulfosediminicola ganghwensis]